ncbi:MAG: response regulator [Gammaproteobacteria bacterium]|nr:MAG: response regulator [Gammaproteobacteria bacterium]
MKSVLVIDDEKQIVELLEFVLEKNGYKVITAANGAFGFRKYKELEPDLVIVDIFMPKKNGMETIDDIMDINNDCKIIAISGGGRIINMDEKIKRLKELGVSFLSKPFEEDELISLVNEVLDK